MRGFFVYTPFPKREDITLWPQGNFVFMAQSMDYGARPWMIDQAIAKLPAQQGTQTLQALQTAVNADIAAKLPYTCPYCGGTGRVYDGNGNLVQDTYCDGWGATETQLTIVRQVTGTTDTPIVST